MSLNNSEIVLLYAFSIENRFFVLNFSPLLSLFTSLFVDKCMYVLYAVSVRMHLFAYHMAVSTVRAVEFIQFKNIFESASKNRHVARLLVFARSVALVRLVAL